MLTIPEDVLHATPISEKELREEISIILFLKGLSLGKAAKLAGMDRYTFRHLLASRDIPMQYDC